MTTGNFKVVALSGSLREGSMNTALLNAIIRIAPESFDTTLHSLSDIPVYSDDIEVAGPPPAVKELRAAVAAADGLIISTPEYNRDMSGALKNALDWLSRPVFEGALNGKDIIALVATESTYHGMGAWVHLAQALRHLNNHVVEPDLVIHSADKALALDSDGAVHITDNWAAQAIAIQLRSLEAAMTAGLGRQGQESTTAFMEALIKPRRAANVTEWPIKLPRLPREPAKHE
jgi:chromate reductase, NAD(P)H dehydrogenase (quinone)